MKKEKGAATILEYAIVLPIVLLIVCMLVFLGYAMHQKAVMEAATQRAAIYISRTLVDPSYETIVKTSDTQDVNDILSAEITQQSIKNKPYRYLLMGRGCLPNSEESVADLIEMNQVFIDKRPNVSVVLEPGVFSKVVVSATQEFEFPQIGPDLSLPSIVTIESESVIYINQPAEFIRNADYIIDTVSKIKDAISEEINSIFSKIKFFNTKVK